MSGHNYPILVSPPTVQRSTAALMKTGQTTSYRTGDDGDLECGRGVDFFTLAENNPFGNTNRFTDELGGQTYTNDIVIDWSTYNGSTVLGYYRRFLTNETWDNQIDRCLSVSIGIFTSGWRLWNMYECMNILNGEKMYNYAPIGISSFNGYCVTSNNKGIYCQKISVTVNGFDFTLDTKAGGGKAIAVRDFTVTGTTLT